MTNKSLAVVIPAFNSAKFIAETLSSILDQTRPADQIVVVDDGSTDETAEVVSTFEGRVTCVRTENNGQGAARALAIRGLDTDYIALCDSDDIWTPLHVERRFQLLQCHPQADFTFSDFLSFGPAAADEHTHLAAAPEGWLEQWCTKDESGFYTLSSTYRALLEFNPAYPSGMVFRRDSYLRMGGFQEKYSRWIGEDSEFTRRFASKPELLFVGDSAQTWRYRRHANNYSAKRWRNIRAKADILDEHLSLGVVPDEYIEATREEIAKARRDAFELSFWDRDKTVIDALYWQLPPNERTIKRKAKRLMGRFGIFPG